MSKVNFSDDFKRNTALQNTDRGQRLALIQLRPKLWACHTQFGQSVLGQKGFQIVLDSTQYGCRTLRVKLGQTGDDRVHVRRACRSNDLLGEGPVGFRQNAIRWKRANKLDPLLGCQHGCVD